MGGIVSTEKKFFIFLTNLVYPASYRLETHLSVIYGNLVNIAQLVRDGIEYVIFGVVNAF